MMYPFLFIKIAILATTKTQQIHSSISNLMIYSYKYLFFFQLFSTIYPQISLKMTDSSRILTEIRTRTGPSDRHATPQADPADATAPALSVRFLLADAMTSAKCSATLEGRRLRIEERWKAGILMALWGKFEWDKNLVFGI